MSGPIARLPHLSVTPPLHAMVEGKIFPLELARRDVPIAVADALRRGTHSDSAERSLSPDVMVRLLRAELDLEGGRLALHAHLDRIDEAPDSRTVPRAAVRLGVDDWELAVLASRRTALGARRRCDRAARRARGGGGRQSTSRRRGSRHRGTRARVRAAKRWRKACGASVDIRLRMSRWSSTYECVCQRAIRMYTMFDGSNPFWTIRKRLPSSSNRMTTVLRARLS